MLMEKRSVVTSPAESLRPRDKSETTNVLGELTKEAARIKALIIKSTKTLY